MTPRSVEQMGGPQRNDSTWRRGLLGALGLGLLIAVASLSLFGASGRDDPYITFSAAEAIMEYARLANINGDPLEQSTTLLFTLILAGLGWMTGVSVPLLGWLVSFSALIAIAPLAYTILSQRLTTTRALVAAAIVITTPPLVYWSASGAEQSLGIALTLGLALLVTQHPSLDQRPWMITAAGLTSISIFLTRPDLGLSAFAATVTLALLAAIRRQKDRLIYLGAITGLQSLLILLVSISRLAVTGSLVPQPMRAKVGTGVIEQAVRGFDYMVANALSPWFVVFLATASFIMWRSRLKRWTASSTFLLLNAGALTAGTILSGGDWMELGRFFAAPATFLILAILVLTQGLSVRAFAGVTSVLLLSPIVTLLFWSAAPVPVDARGSNPLNRWDLDATGSPGLPPELSTPFNTWNADHLGDSYFLGAAVPELRGVLESNTATQFTITSGQGGLIPYVLRQEFGDRIRFIDRFQLMTNDFANCDLDAGTYGSFISWNQWEEFAGECAPDLPDIVFSIGPIPFDDLGDDYHVVVHVQGSAVNQSGSLPQEQWLAVKREHLDLPSSDFD